MPKNRLEAFSDGVIAIPHHDHALVVPMLVITTPTGQIGRQVLGNLLDSGEQLRVIARDPSQLPAEVSGLDTFQMPRPFCAPVMVSLRECRQVPECYTPPTCVSW